MRLPGRLLVAGAVVGAVAVGAVGAMALEDTGSGPAPGPSTTVEVTVAPASSDPTTVAPETAAPAAPTTGYVPGGALPTPPPAPKAGETVQTVPGPNGPIYPDGYTTPTDPATSTTIVLPPQTCTQDPTQPRCQK